MHDPTGPQTESIVAGFTEAASDYEQSVQRNLQGARRLMAAIPDGEYTDVLDVACGTGWSTLAFLGRFDPAHVVGVDLATGMLDVFQERAADLADVDIELVTADVMDMPVAPGGFDAVISTMAFHWFPDKPGAVREMARRLRPGGHLAILTGGAGVDQEFVDLLLSVEPPVPTAWHAGYEWGPTSEQQMLAHLDSAGLEAVDVWLERRLRTTPVDDFLARVRTVSGHQSTGLDPGEIEGHRRRVREAMEDKAGPHGFEHHFCKLFAIARRPD